MTTGDIVVRDVRKSFGHREVLRPVSFTVEAGEIVTLLGPSGCGKTTLLRIIAGLEQADGGEVLVHGASSAEARRSKAIGFVPQAPALLPWRTVRENALLLRQLNRSGGRSTGTGARPTRSNCSNRSASAASSTPTPTSSRGACSSAWRWCGRSPSARVSCSWTNRSPPSTN